MADKPNPKYKRYKDKMNAEKGPEVRGIRAEKQFHEQVRNKANRHIEQLKDIEQLENRQEDW